MLEAHKGELRERSLSKDVYFSEGYFDLKQIYAQGQQIHEIYKMKPQSLVEVGIGNGLTSSFFKQSGSEVLTVDINPNLNPDVVCSIDQMPEFLGEKTFDLVVCCEVLEHMEFEKFEESLKVFKKYSKNLFLTLPQYRYWYGLKGTLKLPRFTKAVSLGFYLRRKKNLDNGHCHFWELDSHSFSFRKKIINILKKYYPNIEHGVFHMNKYHEYFRCYGD